MGVVRLRTKLRLVNACLTPLIARSRGLLAHSVRVFYAAEWREVPPAASVLRAALCVGSLAGSGVVASVLRTHHFEK